MKKILFFYEKKMEIDSFYSFDLFSLIKWYNKRESEKYEEKKTEKDGERETNTFNSMKCWRVWALCSIYKIIWTPHIHNILLIISILFIAFRLINKTAIFTI